MKFIITAPPGTGKSTVMQSVIKDFRGKKRGIIASEILDDKGKRKGFASTSSDGNTKQFMFLSDHPGPDKIGGEYDVDIKVIDDFVVSELRKGLEEKTGLIYIDEIGRAQVLSKYFLSALKEIFGSDMSVLSTIVYEDEPWSMEFKKNPNICLLELTPQNRNILPDILLAAFNSMPVFSILEIPMQFEIYTLLKSLIQKEHYISAIKLFNNTVPYIANSAFTLLSDSDLHKNYQVIGKTRPHKIRFNKRTNTFVCDCDLANGIGLYTGQSQPCSHQLTLRLIEHKSKKS